jgi:hypothetical protein
VIRLSVALPIPKQNNEIAATGGEIMIDWESSDAHLAEWGAARYHAFHGG